jgi:hypothetical protein
VRIRKVYLPAELDAKAIAASQTQPVQFMTLAQASQLFRRRPDPRSGACPEHQNDGVYSCLICYPWRPPIVQRGDAR